MKQVTMKIHGKVQGVSYRYFATKAAKRFGIKGYVRNLADGSVEIVAEGEEDKIQGFISECRRGSFIARVDRVDISYGQPKGKFKDFLIEF